MSAFETGHADIMTSTASLPARAGRLSTADCRLDDLRALVERATDLADYPSADDTERGVLVYDAARLRSRITDESTRAEVQDEIARALLDGPGIAVFRGAFTEEHALTDTTTYFTDTIARQHADGVAGGDHFAKPGANDRVWSALQKLAVDRPDLFVRYYANDVLALVSEAWLGPMYQVTSSINVVNPGGAAQNPHRDYHLGFMSTETAAAFRAHVHRLSPALTLQGAVAHCAMPIESGPTMYLPYSQQYEPGYIAFGLPEFRDFFAQHYVQLPLEAGDAVFFNPALFHAAGHNTTADVHRMANLLQVSSAFGRAIDSVDRDAMVCSLYPELRALADAGRDDDVRAVVAASAEGYAFPTNLDRDPPVTGMAGETQAELVHRALHESMSPEQFAEEVRALTIRHTP